MHAESSMPQDAALASSDTSAPRGTNPLPASRSDVSQLPRRSSDARVASLAVPYITTISLPRAADVEPPFVRTIASDASEAVPPTVRMQMGTTAAPQRPVRHSRLATTLASLSLLLVTSVIGAFGYGFYRYRSLLDVTPVAERDDEPKTRRAVEREEDDERVDGGPSEPPPDVPRRTELRQEGVLSVIDVGLDAPALDQVLREQREIAEEEAQTLVLMLTGQSCEPCRGFDDALADPRMQTALAAVRLIRVDLNVFAEEVERLQLPSRLYPSFFIIGSDLRPVDAIHGGEWDADVAENIAPVLGAFVNGTYQERRHPDFPRTTTSTPM